MFLHARRQFRQYTDDRGRSKAATTGLVSSDAFPILPPANLAPSVLRQALREDAARIMAGHWLAFTHLELPVDDPPSWQRDYLAGLDLATEEPARRLNHRDLPGGADIKLVWELSRWTQLVRLAQAAHVLEDPDPAIRCLTWLEHWLNRNPPWHGWNWTSPLEAGIRLIQITWMDALLTQSLKLTDARPRWQKLLSLLVPAHVRFVWRRRSFGSSANNHLLGELAGLIIATVRWPALARTGASLDALSSHWQREVLAQFAPDGGNREQALHYHLFSFEFCWQTRLALQAAQRPASGDVEERLARAAAFFHATQAAHEAWDYGDSDDAYVTPLFTREPSSVQEWRLWLGSSAEPAALDYWLGAPPRKPRIQHGLQEPFTAVGSWRIYSHSGIALSAINSWWLRWDLSPLGYLKPAAHGHLDALHLSIWRQDVPMVIDPGTGVYYTDTELRAWLASRGAHNGPCPIGPEYPRRAGPFLWSEHHAPPTWRSGPSTHALQAELRLPSALLRRTVQQVSHEDGWEVIDAIEPGASRRDPTARFNVLWQFAPGTQVQVLDNRRFQIRRRHALLEVRVSEGWSAVELNETQTESSVTVPAVRKAEALIGVVSPGFRRICRAPYLLLRADPGDKPCVFSTTFLASPDA
jgi:hypothetical protein